MVKLARPSEVMRCCSLAGKRTLHSLRRKDLMKFKPWHALTGIGLLAAVIVCSAKAAALDHPNGQPVFWVNQSSLGHASDGTYFGIATFNLMSSPAHPAGKVLVEIFNCSYDDSPLQLLNPPRHISPAEGSLTAQAGGRVLTWEVKKAPAFGHPLSLRLKFQIPVHTDMYGSYPYMCLDVSAFAGRAPAVMHQIWWPTSYK